MVGHLTTALTALICDHMTSVVGLFVNFQDKSRQTCDFIVLILTEGWGELIGMRRHARQNRQGSR